MLVVKRLRENYESVIREHRFSMGVFLLAIVLWAIEIGGWLYSKSHLAYKYVTVGYQSLMGVALGVLLCEAIHNYRKQEKESYSAKSIGTVILNAIIIVASAISTAFFVCVQEFYSEIKEKIDYVWALEEVSRDIFILFVVTCLSLSIFFFYKKSKESFESYVAKAFCGLMKAELVYGIIAIGVLLIIVIFNTLIFDTDKFDLLERVEILILGLVEYPCALVGLSKTEGKISKFGKAVLSYVFTALLAIAFVIIYVYILKIIVTWKFPSNEVFAILTALFAFGVCIWTMAQGTCDESFLKIMKILPFFFIPFIVLQIMCLSMRVADYGFTQSRYLGLALIIFEVVYFALYMYKMISGKDIMAIILPVFICATILILFFPGTNVYSVVTRSQKSKLEKYLEQGDATSAQDLARAYQAYNEINSEGGIIGDKYINSRLSKEQIDKMKKASGVTDNGTYVSAYADRALDHLDVSDCSDVYAIELYFHEEDHVGDALDGMDLHSIPLRSKYEDTEICTVDLYDVIKQLGENAEKDLPESDNESVISRDIPTSDGGRLIITSMRVRYYTEKNEYDYISIDGYVLK